jgi:hypothetical protein
VLDCRPRIVVVAVGNNDVLALAWAKARRFFRIIKGLPHNPSAAWFRENLAAIARGLKDSGRATVALCSLPPIGEDPSSAMALHKTPDQVARLNGWCFHSDGIHLNSRGGLILADLVQAFLDGIN